MKKSTTLSGGLLLFFVFASSCNREKDPLNIPSVNPAEEKTLSDFFIKNGTASQLFVINSDIGASLYLPKTDLYIPKNSFVTLTNAPVTGAVTIETKTLLTKKDMILNGIFSVSDGKPLVSGGEFFINATQNGEELKLGLNKKLSMSIDIYGPSSNNMQLFYADNLNENTNWGSPSFTDTVIVIPSSIFSQYVYDVTKLRWINCDYFYNKPGLKTTIKASVVGSEYNSNNTNVFITLDGLNSACMFNSYYNPYFSLGSNYQLPVGQKVTIVALSKINGQYFSALQPATITDNHIENLIMSPTTLDDFKLQLGSLP